MTLYFPFLSPPAPGSGAGSRAGKGKKGEDKVEIGVKRDVTVEEVIGIGLWACWEEEDLRARVPFPVEEQEAREGRETVKWNLRIVEDDGEVDEDFPGALHHLPFFQLSSLRGQEKLIILNGSARPRAELVGLLLQRVCDRARDGPAE